MRLSDLNPRWVGPERVGISMDCPCGCKYRLFVPFQNPIDGLSNSEINRVGWVRSGETFEDLTLTPSIQRELPCNNWHGHITNGEIITLPS